MLTLDPPKPVKFVCALIYASDSTCSSTKKKLIKKFGKIDFESKKIDFTYTDYYFPEMGKPLYRKFISFKKLKNPADFACLKVFCVKLEKKFAKNKKRTINIDPGYLNQAKLVLTSTKDFSHRIYLGRGVFAEVTLLYSNKKYRELPTTFPDYRTDLYKNIFEQIRNIYILQVR